LVQGETAVDAWRRWKENHELEAVDADDYWLLPQVYANLVGMNIDDPELPRLKGIYKQVRLSNELKSRHLLTILKSLNAAGVAGIPGIFPALVLIREDCNMMPLRQLDLIIRSCSLALVDEILQAQAWIPERPLPRPQLLPYITLVNYQHSQAGKLCLYLRPFSSGCPLQADQQFRQRLCEHSIDDVKLLVAGANDLLLMACLNKELVEIINIINRIWLEIDWSTLKNRSSEVGAEAVLLRILGTFPPVLKQGLPEPIASGQMVTMPDHSPGESHSLAALARDLWWRYTHAVGETGSETRGLRHTLGFTRMAISYYHYTWQTENLRQLVLLGVKKTLGRLRKTRIMGTGSPG
jgi:hypothetical protein